MLEFQTFKVVIRKQYYREKLKSKYYQNNKLVNLNIIPNLISVLKFNKINKEKKRNIKRNFGKF